MGEREPPVGRAQLGEHGLVVGGVDDDGRERAVLGGGADHRGPADVDVLDRLGRRGVGAGDGALEGVEVDADEVDGLDRVLGGGAQVLVVVAQREQAGVEAGVQRLHAPVHHLGEAGEVLDGAHRQAGGGELAGGAAGRDELDAELAQAAGEVDDPGLLGDRQQRAAHPHGAGRGALAGRRLGSCRMPRLESIQPVRSRGDRLLVAGGGGRDRARGAGSRGRVRSAPRANRRTASGSSVCSSGRSACSTSLGVARVGQLAGALQDHGAAVDAGVDEVDGDAEDLDPVVERLLDRAQPREGRQQRGVDVDDGARGSARGRARRSAPCSRRARRAARHAPAASRPSRRRARRGRGSRRARRRPSAPRAPRRARARARRRRWWRRRRSAPRARARCRAAPAGWCPCRRRARRSAGDLGRQERCGIVPARLAARRRTAIVPSPTASTASAASESRRPAITGRLSGGPTTMRALVAAGWRSRVDDRRDGSPGGSTSSTSSAWASVPTIRAPLI